jgi:hypothetical protein
MPTNKKISKVPRVGEIVLFAYSLLCFVVCVAFALLLATGHIEDSSLGSNEAQRVDERAKERVASRAERKDTDIVFEDSLRRSMDTFCVDFLSSLSSKLSRVLETCFLPIGRVLFVCRFVRNNETTCNIYSWIG